MQKQIEYKGITREFPSDATDEEISAALEASDKPPLLDRISGAITDMATGKGTAKVQGLMGDAATTAGNLYTKVVSHLPSARTTARVGGAAIGGALGAAGGTVLGTPLSTVPATAVGGAAGASIGESTYQLANRVLGGSLGDDTPTTVGDTLKANAEAQLQGGIQEGAPAFVTSKLPGALRDSAVKNVEQALRPSGIGAKEAIQSAAPNVAERFPVATSSHNLRMKVTDISGIANKAVNDAYTATAAKYPKTQFDGDAIADLVDAATQKHMMQGQPIVGKESEYEAMKKVSDWLRGKRFTLEEFRRIKQEWDEVINWNRFSDSPTKDPAAAAAMESASNIVRGTIHKTFPSLAKADGEASLWATIRAAAKASDIRGVGSEPIKKVIYGTAIPMSVGAGAAYQTGHDPVTGAVLGAALSKLPQTVVWDTLSAATKAELIRFLESTVGKEAVATGSRAGSAMLDKVKTLKSH